MIRSIEFGIWANEQAVVASFLLTAGGIVGLAGEIFPMWEIAAYAIGLGVLTALLEYPRGARLKGNTPARKFQQPLTRVVNCCFFYRSYFIRFAYFIVGSVPCFFTLPTIIGGACFFITSIIYFTAAVKGERWKPIEEQKKEKEAPRGGQVSQPPSEPPPRGPGTSRNLTVEAAEQPSRI